MDSYTYSSDPTLDNNNKSPLKKKSIIGDYFLLETIGTGSFSKVKMAVNKKTNSIVAIKILDKKKMDKYDIIRIKREMKLLTSVNHPNIIEVNEIMETASNYYIVMEFCSKGELFHYICKKKKLNEEEASFFFYQIINGVDYLHKNNISHRDLKPENLLIQSNKMMKIIDFGLSNYFKQNELLKTACGSPCYAPPEMISNRIYNAKAVDIWSIGVILFAMLCGKLPFEDKNNETLFKKILKESPIYPQNLSNSAKQILKKMLIKEPSERIKMEEIKEMPFYLKGKNIFEIKYNECYETVEDNSYFKDLYNCGKKYLKNLETV
ncbi:MAG: serine/threonine-protein kinase [archaeon]|nr:serine/threonine-protein kinase [archaeon]